MDSETAEPGLHHPKHAETLENGIASGGGGAYTPEDVRGSSSVQIKVDPPAEAVGETVAGSLVGDINEVLTGVESRVGDAPAGAFLANAVKRGKGKI